MVWFIPFCKLDNRLYMPEAGQNSPKAMTAQQKAGCTPASRRWSCWGPRPLVTLHSPLHVVVMAEKEKTCQKSERLQFVSELGGKQLVTPDPFRAVFKEGSDVDTVAGPGDTRARGKTLCPRCLGRSSQARCSAQATSPSYVRAAGETPMCGLAPTLLVPVPEGKKGLWRAAHG